MGEDFLRYINDSHTRWVVNLGASYGTEYWQLHDDKRQNGLFKSELAKSKSRFYMRKRLVGLPPEILPCEIVLVVRDAIMNSFMNVQHSQSALQHRGWNPFNRNSLDCPQTLVTAPEDVQKEWIQSFEAGVSHPMPRPGTFFIPSKNFSRLALVA
jgi:hypothetical protein